MNLAIKIKNKLSLVPIMWLFLMLVALWSTAIQNGAINRDGLGYLEQATYFIDYEWKKGFLFYPWPFFSLVIALLYKLTQIHIQIIAHALCFFMFGIAGYYYLKILELISSNNNIIFYGGLILVSSIPIMDDYVGMILRDHGFWAACMAGTYYFILNRQQFQLSNSIKWQVSFFIGGLFRPESFLFIFILPIWDYFANKSKNLRNMFKNYYLLIVLLSVLLLGLLLSNKFSYLILQSRFTDIFEVPFLVLKKISNPLPIFSNDPMLSILINDHTSIISLTILLSIIFSKWIASIGYLNFSIFGLSIFMNKIHMNEKTIRDIYFFTIVSFLIVLFNIFHVYVLSNRYWGFHLWWIYIITSYFLVILVNDKDIKNKFKWLISVMLIISISNVLLDKKENIEIDVAKYINENSITSIDYLDNERISYYVNFNPFTFKDYHQKSKFNYKLIKSLDEESLLQIEKKFPDVNPKFYLIKNDE